MPLRERAYSVLIVSASEAFNHSLRGLLPPKDYDPVCIASSVSRARRCVQERPSDIVLINAPLPDEFGGKFAIDACATAGCVPLLLVRGDLYDETCAKVRGHGVMTLRKPASAAQISQALDWLCAVRERLRSLEKKAMSLEDKMADIRIINRAKWALIESLHMTESDAHRYIEKQAMDRCVTMREVAQGILRTHP